VVDSNPINAQHDGVNNGATWAATNTDGTTTRTGVMSFIAEQTNGITLANSTSLETTNGTVTFWMESSGTDENSSGNNGAAIYGSTTGGSTPTEFLIDQDDSGTITFSAPGGGNISSSSGHVSDGKWHFVAVSFDNSQNGFADIYIDGTLSATNGNAQAWTWPSAPVEIGYTSDPGIWRNYNGVLDDVRYYSVILSGSQLSTIFASGNSGALADPADLQLQFNFTAAPGGASVITWGDATAVLQTSTSLNGGWTDVVGAVSPYTYVPSGVQQYFRIRFTAHAPQSYVSNPYLM
jgi:hypothetical protein